LFPGLAIIISVLTFAILGDAVKRLVEPTSRGEQ
ncbi:MAG: hypothetical protein QOG58_3202, partial [Caballeronia sp.]|nr:hypothetical protein [Caballeronia sp.]